MKHLRMLLTAAALVPVLAGSAALMASSASAAPVLHQVKAVNGHLPPGRYLLVAASQKGSDPGELCEGGTGTGGLCLNAWNGGPFVKAYGANVTNDAFSLVSTGGLYYAVEYTNTGNIIGDVYNNKNDARAGLTDTGAWGTVFTIGSSGCGSGFAIRNNHWGAYLGFSFFSGAQAYLNTSAVCFTAYSF